MMTVGELKEMLEGLDDDTMVRLATQASYPLAFELRGARTQADIDVDEAFEGLEERRCDHVVTLPDCDDCNGVVDEDAVRENAENVVWLVEGGSSSHPYAPRAAWQI